MLFNFKCRFCLKKRFFILTLVFSFLICNCGTVENIDLCTITELPLIKSVSIPDKSGNINMLIEFSECGTDADDLLLEYLDGQNKWQPVNSFDFKVSANDEMIIELVWNSALEFFNTSKEVKLKIIPMKNNQQGSEYIADEITIDNRFTNRYTRLDQNLEANPTTTYPQAKSVDNKVFTCWFDARHFKTSLYASFSKDSGYNWSEQDIRLDTNTDGKPLYPVTTILDQENNFRVFWFTRYKNTYSIYTNGLNSDGSLLYDEALEILTLPDNVSNLTELALTQSGNNFIISFSDNRNEILQGRFIVLSSDFEILKNIPIGQIDDTYHEEYYITLFAEGDNIHSALRRSGDTCNLIYRKFTENGMNAEDEIELFDYRVSDPDSGETIGCYLEPKFFKLENAVGLAHLSPSSLKRNFILQKITADGAFHQLPNLNENGSAPLLSLVLCQNEENQTYFVWTDSKDDNIYSVYSQLMNADGSLSGNNTRLDIVDKDLMSYAPFVSCGKSQANVLWMDYSFDTDIYYLQSTDYKYNNHSVTHFAIMSGEMLGNPSHSYGVTNTAKGFMAYWHDYKLPSRSITLATRENADYQIIPNRIPGSDKLENGNATSPEISGTTGRTLTSWYSPTLKGNRAFLQEITASEKSGIYELEVDNIEILKHGYDKNKTPHVLFMKDTDIYLSELSNGELNYTTLINSNDQSDFSAKEAQLITFADSSNVLVLWRDIRNSVVNLYGRLFTRDTGWKQEFKINDNRGPNGSEVNVLNYKYAISPLGDILIAYNGSSQGVSILFTRTLKDHGETLQEVSNNLHRTLNTAIEYSMDWADYGKYIALMYITNGQTAGTTIPYYTYSTDGGISFYGSYSLMDEGIYHQPKVFFTSVDQINLLWFKSDPENNSLTLESTFTADYGHSFSDPSTIFTAFDTSANALNLTGCINSYGKGIMLIQSISGLAYNLEMLQTRSYGWEWFDVMQLNPENSYAAQADLICKSDGTMEVIYGITLDDTQQIAYTHLP